LRVADRVQNADTVKLSLPLPMCNVLGIITVATV
jgi:hypothetical protein